MKKRRSPFGCLILLLFMAVLCAAGVYAYRVYMPTNETADMDQIYNLKNEREVAVFLNYEEQGSRGIYEDGQTYLPIDWVNENLNERFYWDANEKLLVYALPEEIVTATAETVGEGGKALFKDQDDTIYLSLGLILNYTDIRMNVYDGGTQKRVYIQNEWSPVSVAEIRSNGKIRVKGGVKSPIITAVSKGESVVVLETMENWSRVWTQDGHIGYLYNRRMEDIREETPVSTFEAPVYQNISLDEKINLVWHQVTVAAANSAMEELIDATKGVNVIAPTWYVMSDNDGSFESLASKSYVDRAHEKGLQVWAVVDNFSREPSQNVKTDLLLSKTSVRHRLVDRLIEEARTYGFDGINLDFESLGEAAGVHYIQFIRELSVACRREGLVLSIDNPVPAAYNEFYNRREQGIVADYVIIMGYDEHYSGGDTVGSVASLGFVEKGIRDTLDVVPNEKVINGVPFYTRLWTKDGDSLSSRALGIAAAERWLESNEVELTWDEETGQYYGELDTEEGLVRLWMEESRSLGLKMEQIKENDLAGVAGWRLGLETPEIWDIISWK